MSRYLTETKKDTLREMNGPGTLQEFMPDKKKTQSQQLKEGNEKIISMHQEIVNLYIKIKRCSKDVNLTES